MPPSTHSKSTSRSLDEKILSASIYLLPFAGFGFFKGGLGWIQPSQFVLIILFFWLAMNSSSRRTEILGKQSSAFLFCFFAAALLSAFLSVIDSRFVSLARSAGVLVSLVVFFLSYYTASRVNNDPMKGLTFIGDFIKVSWFVSITILIEYSLYKATGVNYFVIAERYLVSALPYPSMGIADLAGMGRFKGILVEPGDVGYFCLPAWGYLLNLVSLRASKGKYLSDIKPVNLKFHEVTGLVLFPLVCVLTQSFVVLLLLIAVFILTLLSKGKMKGGLLVLWFKLFVYLCALAVGSFFIVDSVLPYLDAGIVDRFIGVSAYFQDGSMATNASVKSFLVSGTAVSKAFDYDLLLGVGPGSFSIIYDQATSSIGLRDFYFNRNDGFLMLFRLLGETGIVGTFCFSSVFVSRFIESQKQVRSLEKASSLLKESECRLRLLLYGQGIEYAALISLIYAYLGNASYWYPIVPILFGISFKYVAAKRT